MKDKWKLKVQNEIIRFDLLTRAVLHRHRWCHICHETWSQWVLSVSPLNLTVEKQEGFKRELMNWPFPFHLFLISVRLQLTFSATYQVSRPPRLRTLSPTQHERSSSKLVLSPVWTDFLHLTHNYRQGRGLHNKPWHTILPEGTKAVYWRTDFSTAGCQMWKYLFWLFAVWWSCTGNNKEPIMKANKVLEVVILSLLPVFFFVFPSPH